MQGPHNRAVSCPLCNEKFFPASLPFHQKQCEKRRAKRIVNCPYCNIEISQLQLPDHIKCCPKGGGKRERSRPPAQGASGGGGGGGDGGGHNGRGGGAGHQPAEVCPVAGNFEPDVLEDGRMRCIYCGRYFNPDRIDKHQSICGKLKNARPAGVDGAPTQNGRKVFNSAAQRVEGGSSKAFLTPAQYKREQDKRMREAAEEKARRDRTRGRWRAEHAQFQEVCKAGRGEDTLDLRQASPGGRRPDGTVPCPHCGRRFEANAAERHIPICANVKSRPRPPPSPGTGTPPSPLSPGRRDGSPGPALRRPNTGSSSVNGSRSCGRLPSVPPGGTPKRERPSASASTPGGTGTQAARSLRSNGSAAKRLPGLAALASSTSSTADPTLTIRDGGVGPEADQTWRPPSTVGDGTESSGSGFGLRQSQRTASNFGPNANAQTRLGLRRTAMLFRLLSHVPRPALERELTDAGIQVSDGMDEDALIEAIMEKLV